MLGQRESERAQAINLTKGCAQRKGIDYDEVFAPVAHHETIRVLLSVAAAKGMHVHQMDVTTAFLIPELQEELYMELPDGWPSELPGDRQSQVFCKLVKTLYGLKQSPRVWNAHLNDWMVSQGFTRSMSDSCLYTRPAGAGLMYVTVWVDDLLISCKSEDEINSFKATSSR